MRSAAHHYREFMRAVGIDVTTPHAKDTPERVARMFHEFTAGLREPDFQFTAFPKNPKHTYDQLIVMKDIPLTSMCAHHHVAYIGKAHVGYLPGEQIIGLSKIVRLVRWVSHKPSIQEELTQEIADAMVDKLNPRAVCVLVEAEHGCISSRGVRATGTKTITHCVRGKLGLSLKEEFLSIIGR